MNEQVYRKLADHLDRLPGGFAPSETGAELRLLERLFSLEEAELAVHLTLDGQAASTVAARAGRPLAEVEPRLDEMARKGLLFATYPEEGPTLYWAAPWAIGIYEFQVDRLSEGLLQDVGEFYRTRKPRPPVQAIPQMRTIPVAQSIDQQARTMPYEQVHALVEAHDRYAVAPCICRRMAKMEGQGCDAPEETCLMFGEFADYYVRNGKGRAIERAEVYEILARADAANLVLQPTNSQRISAICCCCPCCCGPLRSLKNHAKPAEAAANSFRARLDADVCLGCWTCLDRCQMEALTEAGDLISLNADRCIGCGLCVSTCPSGALTLERKPGAEPAEPPVAFEDMLRIINRQQAAARQGG